MLCSFLKALLEARSLDCSCRTKRWYLPSVVTFLLEIPLPGALFFTYGGAYFVLPLQLADLLGIKKQDGILLVRSQRLIFPSTLAFYFPHFGFKIGHPADNRRCEYLVFTYLLSFASTQTHTGTHTDREPN